MDNQRKDQHDPERPQKGTAPNNYRLITCLLMMWQIPTIPIKDIYYSLINHGLFPGKKKGCCKGTRGTGELLQQQEKD